MVLFSAGQLLLSGKLDTTDINFLKVLFSAGYLVVCRFDSVINITGEVDHIISDDIQHATHVRTSDFVYAVCYGVN